MKKTPIIRVRTLQIPIDDITYKRLKKKKGSDTWQSFLGKIAYED